MLFSGLRKQSDTTYKLFFMLISVTDHISGLTGKLGSVTVSLSKNGAGGGAPAGAIGEVDATNFPGLYSIAGNATDTNTLGPLFIHAKDAASDPYDSKYDIVNYDSFTFLPSVNVSQWNGHAALEVVNGSPVVTLGTAQAAYAPAKAGDSMAVSDKTGFSLSATGADLILKTATFVQAIAAAINELATYGLTALNTLLVTTGIKAASIPAAELTEAYDAAKTAAQVGDAMTLTGDLTGTMKASVKTAAQDGLATVPEVQDGLATAANQTTINNNILAVPAAVWAVTTRTLSSFGTLVADVVAAVWNYLLTAITTTGSIGKLIKDNVDGKVSERGMILPVMTGRAYAATIIQDRKIEIVQGDTPRLPFDFNADYSGWTPYFGAKAKLTDTDYAINPKAATWIDATKGQGYVDLTAAETATCGKFLGEVELRNGDSRLTPIKFTLIIIGDVIKESAP